MENRTGKLATAAAAVVLTGVSAVLDSPPARAQGAPVFALRPKAAARPAEIPLPVGRRPPSPLPIAGDGFSDDPMESLVRVEVLPPERPIDDDTRLDVPDPAPRQSFRALTSFDERTEMTSGSFERPATASARSFPPPPARWNNPIRWLSTHEG